MLLVALTLVQFPLLVVTIILVAPYGITAVAWARVGGMALWVGLTAAGAARAMDMSLRRSLTAMWPGAAASGGVVACSGAVRLFAGLAAIPELVAAVVAGFTGAAIALAVLSPGTFHELREAGRAALRGVLVFRRSSEVPERSDGEGPAVGPISPAAADALHDRRPAGPAR